MALPRGYQSMPESAASGLWTTPSDLAKLLIMFMDANDGKKSYLSKETIKDMMTPVSPSSYGLGPVIKQTPDGIQFSHNGANDSYRAQIVGSMEEKRGIVICTNGTEGLDLIEEILPLFDFHL